MPPATRRPSLRRCAWLLGRERDDLTAAERSYVEHLKAAESELSGLATGVTRDKGAVAAASTEPWSTSPVERHINRLKTLKRSVYSWAGYDVLRARMLAA